MFCIYILLLDILKQNPWDVRFSSIVSDGNQSVSSSQLSTSHQEVYEFCHVYCQFDTDQITYTF